MQIARLQGSQDLRGEGRGDRRRGGKSMIVNSCAYFGSEISGM